MTNTIVELNMIVDNFLIDTPNPTKNDWKDLIEANPHYAMDIADIAMIHATFEDTSEAAELNFDQHAYDSTISHVLNQVYQSPSPLILNVAQKLEPFKGPKIKDLSEKIGIGAYPSLINGILAGRVIAPSILLLRLSSYLQVSFELLTQFIQFKLEGSSVPAFKSTNNKPELRVEPKSWKDAVTSLDLSDVETDRLLKLQDEHNK